MSKLKLTVAAAVLTLVASRGFAVTNAVVGTCVAGTHYTTIQAAVNAATSPSTVQICPSTYREQIEIKSALTLKGVTQGTSNSVVILPPAKGLASNSLSGLFGKLFVNVYVHANAAVTISNITIDGAGGTACPATGYRVGLLYQGGGGSVTNSSFVDSPTCAKSIAAMADVTSGFSFTNNTLTDCGGVCFELDYGDTTTVSGNTITQFKNGAIGIDIQHVAGPATISNNIITGNLLSTGIYSTNSTDLTFGLEMCVAFLDTIDSDNQGNLECDHGQWGPF